MIEEHLERAALPSFPEGAQFASMKLQRSNALELPVETAYYPKGMIRNTIVGPYQRAIECWECHQSSDLHYEVSQNQGRIVLLPSCQEHSASVHSAAEQYLAHLEAVLDIKE
jgi:hypothetical protein